MTELRDPHAPPRQPMLNVPAPVITLTVILMLAFGLQLAFLSDAEILHFAVSRNALTAGRLDTLIIAQFLHVNLAHVLANAAFALAFGSPVARRLGRGWWGGLVFAGLYLSCGVLAWLGFAAVHTGGAPAIGASGAVAGLMGASSRLLEHPWRVAPMNSPGVLQLGGSWLLVNFILGLIGFVPGMEGASIAWEAHLAGFAAGLILIGPAVRLSSLGR